MPVSLRLCGTEGGSSPPRSFPGIDRTRKWNVSPGLFKEQDRLGAAGAAKQGASGRRAPLRTRHMV